MVRRWLRDEFAVAISDSIIGEVATTLANEPCFLARFDLDERAAIPDLIRAFALDVGPLDVVPGVAPHRHDAPVPAVVAAAGANRFVTGDAALRATRSYAGVPSADPARFLDLLGTGDD